MCGICGIFNICVSTGDLISYIDDIENLLKARGPDSWAHKSLQINSLINSHFYGSILWLQGEEVIKQPYEDNFGNILLWNGDILDGYQLENNKNDTVFISQHLYKKNTQQIMDFMGNIKGPWAFMYYSISENRLYFGRDVFGRHSLLWRLPDSANSQFVLSSVMKKEDGHIEEVPAIGIYFIDFNDITNIDSFKIQLVLWNHILPQDLDFDKTFINICSNINLTSPILYPLNVSQPTDECIEILKSTSPVLSLENLTTEEEELLNTLYKILHKSIERRVNKCPSKCNQCTFSKLCPHNKYGVLFSGGLDSAVIALLLDKCLPKDEGIDLINVAFQLVNKPNVTHKKKATRTPTLSEEENISYEVPDRISGRACWQELSALKPNRKWNFIEVNVTTTELKEERERIIKHLVWPLSSVLDDSIGCALWFAGRGCGFSASLEYQSTCRVLLCGMGADEQFGGYSRHRAKFNNEGWSGLISEVQMEMKRIYKRNLGRDNRILAFHGRAPRFPFLDEDLVSYLNSLPLHKKTNLYLPRGVGEKILLRRLALSLGLQSAAVLPKRAIQFGSRIAKLETSKEKGSDVCKRL